jgi:hypothetical protein
MSRRVGGVQDWRLARRRLQFYPTSLSTVHPSSRRPVFRPNGSPKRGSSRIPFALDDRRVQGSRRRHDFQSIGRGGRRGRDRWSDVVVDVGPKSLLRDEVVAWFRRSETRSRNQFNQNFRSFILMLLPVPPRYPSWSLDPPHTNRGQLTALAGTLTPCGASDVCKCTRMSGADRPNVRPLHHGLAQMDRTKS